LALGDLVVIQYRNMMTQHAKDHVTLILVITCQNDKGDQYQVGVSSIFRAGAASHTCSSYMLIILVML